MHRKNRGDSMHLFETAGDLRIQFSRTGIICNSRSGDRIVRRKTDFDRLHHRDDREEPVYSKLPHAGTSRQGRQRPDLSCSALLYCRLFLMLVLSLPGVADTQSIRSAQTAYEEGRFTDAARAGEILGTSEGYALAAASLTIHAYHIAGDDEKEALLRHAVELARKAVHANSDNADAHLQLARAVGRYAQVVSPFLVAGRGYAEQVHESTEKALQIDPDMVSAHLSLGRWHAELISAMGPLMARMIYRARARDAIAAFERALELAPRAKAVPLEYALALLALDEKGNHARVHDLLVRTVRIPARNAYEQILHDMAVKYLEALALSGG